MTIHSFARLSVVLLAALAIGLTACQKDRPDEELEFAFSEAELADLRANTCLTEDTEDGYDLSDTPEAGAQDRASGAKNKFWSPGQKLRVRFLNGTSALQDKVFNYAQEWEKYANVDFVRVSSGTAEIRIAFDKDGHWSYLGKDNLSIPSDKKTMNLEFTSSTPESQVRGTTFHEFGHVLGLLHEQQHPMSSIPWNVQAVYSYYAKMGWDKKKVDQQVLNKNTWESSQHTNYDSKSIMQYPVPAQLTTNGFSIGTNSVLSSSDKDFITKMYSSSRIRVRHAANTSANITFWLNGIYHTLKPGESLWAPAKTSGNQFSVWECPNGACKWEDYAPAYGKNYKIVSAGSNGNLTLSVD
ncbi:MAG: M12 family metallopeptidase [Saprospiraceae bacterium]|nr:M12 family metallopeptidase [Saprospiraceae bacterium]